MARNAIYEPSQTGYFQVVSRTAEALLEQFRTLSPAEQRELLQQLLRSLPSSSPQPDKPFPTVKVGGGLITAKQVAEALDDE